MIKLTLQKQLKYLEDKNTMLYLESKEKYYCY